MGRLDYIFLDNKQCRENIDVNRSFFLIGGRVEAA
jgi:hypothetical protein